MHRVIGICVVAVVAGALLWAGSAAGGKKKLEKLDKESETGDGHVGFVIGATRSPTNKFLIKVTSKPKGVEVVLAGQILCAPKKGDKAKTAPVNVRRTTPFQLTVKPSLKKNRFCDMTVPLDANGLTRRTTVTGKVFHKG